MKEKLLIYAHYYYPDVASTGQLLKELAEGMKQEFDITVICTVPSYEGFVPANYRVNNYYFEECNGVHIIRVRVPEFNKKQKSSRIRHILAYFFRAIVATFQVGKIDYIYAVSQPPVLGGMLGVIGKFLKRARFIYNIQDFNPEQTIATGYSQNPLLIKAMMACDKFSCRRANQIILVGRDMVNTLKFRFKGKKCPSYTWINNWIDEKKIRPLDSSCKEVAEFKNRHGLSDCLVIMYSGNLGLYYDLENLMHVIEKFPKDTKTKDGKNVIFVFVGAGSIKDTLVSYKEKHQMDNVLFIPYQKKEDLVYSLNAGDVHWVINAKGMRGISVPSKMYGIMAASKPVLGVQEKGSEVRIMIDETRCGIVCEPGDYIAIEENIKKILSMSPSKIKEMGSSGREYLTKNLTKEVSIRKYIETIKQLRK